MGKKGGCHSITVAALKRLCQQITGKGEIFYYPLTARLDMGFCERQCFIEKAGLYSTFCSFSSFNVFKNNAYLSTWLWLFLRAMSFFSAEVQELVLAANSIFYKLQ